MQQCANLSMLFERAKVGFSPMKNDRMSDTENKDSLLRNETDCLSIF